MERKNYNNKKTFDLQDWIDNYIFFSPNEGLVEFIINNLDYEYYNLVRNAPDKIYGMIIIDTDNIKLIVYSRSSRSLTYLSKLTKLMGELDEYITSYNTRLFNRDRYLHNL